MTKEEPDGGISVEEARKEYGELENFYKQRKGDTIWWTAPVGYKMVFFSFDRKTLYMQFGHTSLTPEQKETFYRENPLWKGHFG